MCTKRVRLRCYIPWHLKSNFADKIGNSQEAPRSSAMPDTNLNSVHHTIVTRDEMSPSVIAVARCFVITRKFGRSSIDVSEYAAGPLLKRSCWLGLLYGSIIGSGI